MPQSVGIAADSSTITVSWTRPATDAAASYRVDIYADGSAYTTVAKTYSGIPYTGTFTGLTISGNSYSFVLPSDHGLAPGEGGPLHLSVFVA